MASTDVIGKIFGIYLPVAYFIIGGFEHCIANQYLLYQVSLLPNQLAYQYVSSSHIKPF